MGIALGNYFAFFIPFLDHEGLMRFMDCHSICFIELDRVGGSGGLGAEGGDEWGRIGGAIGCIYIP